MTDDLAVYELRDRARERVLRRRPDLRCPTPGCEGEMEPRRSGLHEGPADEGYHADDSLKCPRCVLVVTHGQRVRDVDRELELRRRNSDERGYSTSALIVDFVRDLPAGVERDERLRALGYL